MTPLARLFSIIPRRDDDPINRERSLHERRDTLARDEASTRARLNQLRNELDQIAGELDTIDEERAKASAEAIIAAAALADAGGHPLPPLSGVAAQMVAAWKKSRGEQ